MTSETDIPGPGRNVALLRKQRDTSQATRVSRAGNSFDIFGYNTFHAA